MKLFSYHEAQRGIRLGFVQGQDHYDLEDAASHCNVHLPSNMKDFLRDFVANLSKANTLPSHKEKFQKLDLNHLSFLAPVDEPSSLRDAYAFRQHVESARRGRGLPMIPEFDRFPVFYFSNHRAVLGEGDVLLEEDHFLDLDFELEVAIVIGREGKNIACKDADDYIAGLMIMNDFSARKLQREEMKLNLGPAKGKDFATSLGPYLVTMDSLKEMTKTGAKGAAYHLEMKAYHNCELVSQGNLSDMSFTFAQIIERVSYGVTIYPGDVIGSGTVGTGCFLELNATNGLKAKENGKDFEPTWLKDGDVIELEVQNLGCLKNKVVKR